MRQILHDILLVLTILIIIAWPAGLQEGIIEPSGQVKVTPQSTPEPKEFIPPDAEEFTSSESEKFLSLAPKELKDKTIIALQRTYTNLSEIIKMGYETHPEEFVTASNSFNDALSYFPSFTKDHPYTVPYLKILLNAEGEKKIVEADEQPQQQAEDDVEKAFPFAENSRKVSQNLLEKISAAKLEQTLRNLEFIRTVDRDHLGKYPEAHDAFIEARKRLPAFEIPEPSSKMKDNDRLVTLNIGTQTRILAKSPMKFKGQNNYYEAAEYIRKSYDITQKILAEYYLEEVVGRTQTTRKKLGETTQNDPDNAIQGFTQKLDENLRYAETVKEDPRRIALERITETNRTRRDAEFNLNITQHLNRTVEFDIFFDEGKYALSDLSEEGKRVVREVAEGLVAAINDYAKMYPGQPITITIKTVGYADQLGFHEETDLTKRLTKGAEDELPQYQSARRKFLNTRLSLFRARSINEAIQHLVVFSETINKEVRLNIQPEIEGKGEEIPPGVPAPYPEADQRRRICKISNIVWSP